MADILQTDIFKCIFLNENICILIYMSSTFVPVMIELTIFQHWFRQWFGAVI